MRRHHILHIVAFALGCTTQTNPSLPSIDRNQTPPDENLVGNTPTVDSGVVLERDDASASCDTDAIRLSQTICGLNNEGFLYESCVGGMWTILETATCSGVDVCTNEAIQSTEVPCGLNNTGQILERCEAGQWVETDQCDDPSICRNGDLRESSVTCGLNDEGYRLDECVDGQWQLGEICTGEDMCVTGQMRAGDEICGLNDSGVLLERCDRGLWEPTNECTSVDVCENGNTRRSMMVCGPNQDGRYLEACTDGMWRNSGRCNGATCLEGSISAEYDSCGASSTSAEVTVCTNRAETVQSVCSEDGNRIHTERGRRLTLTKLEFESSDTNLVIAQPNEELTLLAEGNVINLNNACPTCITQFYLKLPGHLNLCLGSTTGDWSFDETVEFRAPAQAGIYFINTTSSWEYECIDTASVAPDFSSKTAAFLIVIDS